MTTDDDDGRRRRTMTTDDDDGRRHTLNPFYLLKDLKCVVVVRHRCRRRPSVPIEFPRKYISYIAAFEWV